MIDNLLDCLCQAVTTDGHNHILEEFGYVRNKCSALKEILVPDDIWPNFKKTALQDKDEDRHLPILLLSFQCGFLKKFTSPIHRYLIQGVKLKKELTKQYKEDLQERWMQEKDVLKCHQRRRSFIGKITELQCAEWIEKQGWRISDLEALSGGYDIETFSPNNIDCAIEVKYIGVEDDYFLSIEKNLSGNFDLHMFSVYASSDYILFRAYEAAKQLQKCTKTRIAFLVIASITWGCVEIPLKEDWMNWHSPKFFNNDPDWVIFFEKQKNKFPDIENDLKLTLDLLNELWIIKQEDDFQYSLQHVINFNGYP